MRRIVLPSNGVGIGGETIAKILFCLEIAEPARQPGSGIRIDGECLPVTEREIARRLKPSLNRGLAITPPYCRWLTLSYRVGVRFLDSTWEVIYAPSFGRTITLQFRPVEMALTATNLRLAVLSANNKLTHWIVVSAIYFIPGDRKMGLRRR
jgi:hypothetical protein